MLEYEYIFCTELRRKINSKVFATVQVQHKRNDALEITIIREEENWEFEMMIDNLTDKILHGYSTDYAVYEIMKEYRQFILGHVQNRFFKGRGGIKYAK